MCNHHPSEDSKKEEFFFFKLNMAGFETASSCYKHHCSTLLPISNPFPQLITEHSVKQHYRNRNVCDISQRKKVLV